MKKRGITYHYGYSDSLNVSYRSLETGQFFICEDGQLRMKMDDGYVNLQNGSSWPDINGYTLPQVRIVRAKIKVKAPKVANK